MRPVLRFYALLVEDPWHSRENLRHTAKAPVLLEKGIGHHNGLHKLASSYTLYDLTTRLSKDKKGIEPMSVFAHAKNGTKPQEGAPALVATLRRMRSKRSKEIGSYLSVPTMRVTFSGSLLGGERDGLSPEEQIPYKIKKLTGRQVRSWYIK